MTKVRYVQKNGKQLIIGMDDDTRVIALPTSQGMWKVSGSGGDPGPGPGPGNDDIAWPYTPDVITSGYGPRTGGVGTFHEGIDFSGGKAVTGADNMVCADGKVTFAGSNSGFGNYVVVYHGELDGFDFYTVYGHQLDNTVTAGDNVSQGDVVGHLDSTGQITGPCLHWETHKVALGGNIIWNTTDNGNPRTAVDPVQFMADYGGDTVLNA